MCWRALRMQRVEARALEWLDEMGGEVAVWPPQKIEGHNTLYLIWHARAVALQQARLDSVLAARDSLQADSLLRVPVTLPAIRWRKVEPSQQGPFVDRYGEVFWQAAGAMSPIDTVSTPRLRAHLTGLFGTPTRNAAAAEQEGYAGSEHVQFEYWFVVNDTIPILVLDRDGPFGHGLLVAGDETQAELLSLLKHDLADRIDASFPAAYVDYYHDKEGKGWFRTLYDGATYLTEKVRRPRWARRLRQNEKWRIFR